MDRIGPYEIQGELGRGGMGVVYRGVDPRTRRPVAVKVLTKGRDAPPKQQRRFAREARALSAIAHPNVVRLREFGEHDGYPYLVMDLHADGSLAATLAESGPLSPGNVTRIGVGVASALVAVHAEDVLHRDIKPDNVLINASGSPLLTDFGLAKSLDPSDESSKITQQGTLTGTPGYWAPEQTAGESAACGPWTDVYGLGATLYAALTGHPPADGESLVEMLVATASVAPPSIRATRPEVPEQLEAIVMRCLEKRPEDRWANAGELRAALSDQLAGEGHSTPPAESAPDAVAEPSVRYLRLVLAACGIVATGVLLGVLIASRAGSPPSGERALPVPDGPQLSATLKQPSSLEELAQQGDVEAMVELGRQLAKGKGRPQDRAAAYRWYRAAAQRGSPSGMFRLGYALLNGRGVQRDEQSGRRWLERAVALGDPRPMVNLGVLAQEHQQLKIALDWYFRGAAAGEARAMHNLGVLYEKGIGLPQDQQMAAAWYFAAATFGLSQSQYQLARMLTEGRGVSRDDEAGRRWYEKAAAQGHGPSQVNLGYMHLLGLGGPKDERTAADWYARAAEAGVSQAMVTLANMLEDGLATVRQDQVAARHWYRKAAEKNNLTGAHHLARMLWDGEETAQSSREALKWCKQAATGGNVASMTLLGFMLTTSRCGPPDYKAAVAWYRRAGATGNPTALYNLGLLLAQGRGVPRDDSEAARCFSAAAAAKNDPVVREKASSALAKLKKRSSSLELGVSPQRPR